jgi:hypothetical protein
LLFPISTVSPRTVINSPFKSKFWLQGELIVHSFPIAATAVISNVPVFSQVATVAAPDVSALAYAREIVLRTQPDEHERDAQEARSRIRLEQWRDAVTARYTVTGVLQIVSAFIDGLLVSGQYRRSTGQ